MLSLEQSLKLYRIQVDDHANISGIFSHMINYESCENSNNCDFINPCKNDDTFVRIEDAIDFVMKSILNTDKDKKWFMLNNHHSWINEYNGKLYNHWVYESYDKSGELFEDYDESKPKTLDDLREYLKYNKLLTNWDTRCPVAYTIGSDWKFVCNCGNEQKFCTVCYNENKTCDNCNEHNSDPDDGIFSVWCSKEHIIRSKMICSH